MLFSKSALAVATACLASAVYQYIVFDYTKVHSIHKNYDWHQYVILFVSGLCVALGSLHAYRRINAGQTYEAMYGVLLIAPALILFTYAFHCHQHCQVRSGPYHEFARQFAHLYSGMTLAIMIVAAVLAVPAILQHAMDKKIKA